MNSIKTSDRIEAVLTPLFEIDPKDQSDYEAVATKLRWLDYQTVGKQNRVIALAIMRTNAYCQLYSWRLNMLAQTRMYHSDAPDVAFKQMQDMQNRIFVQGPEDCPSEDGKYMTLRHIICIEDNTHAIVVLTKFLLRFYGWNAIREIFY